MAAGRNVLELASHIADPYYVGFGTAAGHDLRIQTSCLREFQREESGEVEF
jgi:hypothetical protein